MFCCGDLMLFISELWVGCLKSMGCLLEKIVVLCMGVDMMCFFYCLVKVSGMLLEMIFVVCLIEKKGLYVVIEVCW